ncbi:MAG: CDP-alcohol phosphatidyltransferase family protein [Elusimicrobiota bacterium]|nr:CDP-alcohol phosphatidyltransferase family protein [Elusimicrobiota bacterium]
MINLANILTLLRIFLVPVFLFTLFNNLNTFLPVSIFLLCIITDFLDGLIARAFNLKTTIGIHLDPIADKVLVLSSYFVLTMLDRVPIWLFIIILGKDVIVISGWLLIYILSRKFLTSVGLLGKLNLIIQTLTILAVLLCRENFSKLILLFHLTAFLTVITTIEYCIKGAKEITSIYAK